MAGKEKKSKFLIFAGDIFTLVCSLIFVAYIAVIIQSDNGKNWFNYSMLAVTLLFCLFLIVKIFVINIFFGANEELSRRMKTAVKTIKFLLKLAMLAVIIAGLVTIVKFNEEGLLLIASTVTSNIFFFLFLILDTALLIRERKRKKNND